MNSSSTISSCEIHIDMDGSMDYFETRKGKGQVVPVLS